MRLLAIRESTARSGRRCARGLLVMALTLLLATGGAAGDTIGTKLTVSDVSVTIAIIAILSPLDLPHNQVARYTRNEASAIASLRTTVSSRPMFHAGDERSGYTTELTGLDAGFQDWHISPGLRTDLTIQSIEPPVTRGIFTLQAASDGTPDYSTTTSAGQTVPILGPMSLNLGPPVSGSQAASLPAGTTVTWMTYDEMEFNAVFSPTDPDPAASMAAALAASLLETIEIDYATAIFDINGRLVNLTATGQRQTPNFANYERLFGITASNDAFVDDMFIVIAHDPQALVPEPATLSLLALGGLALRY